MKLVQQRLLRGAKLYAPVPNDVMAFACGTSLTVLVDALRPLAPESAERIGRQVASPP